MDSTTPRSAPVSFSSEALSGGTLHGSRARPNRIGNVSRLMIVDSARPLGGMADAAGLKPSALVFRDQLETGRSRGSPAKQGRSAPRRCSGTPTVVAVSSTSNCNTTTTNYQAGGQYNGTLYQSSSSGCTQVSAAQQASYASAGFRFWSVGAQIQPPDPTQYVEATLQTEP
jgi:hypothetical protein